MYDISELKVGDIMVCGDAPHRQLFYIHNINISREKITTSGVSEDSRFLYFDKDVIWAFDRKAKSDEAQLFYDLIDRYGFKFNINTGVKKSLW